MSSAKVIGGACFGRAADVGQPVAIFHPDAARRRRGGGAALVKFMKFTVWRGFVNFAPGRRDGEIRLSR